MSSKDHTKALFENVEIIDAGAEGKAIARINEMVVFVPYAAPGDIIDVQIIKKKKTYMEGRIVSLKKQSDKRVAPFCEHFGLCGGCKWQHISYEQQLYYKQKQIKDNLKRIGKLEIPEIMSIIPSENTEYYRNKLEFTFSNRKWLTDYDKERLFEKREINGLGFHIPGMFDKIVDINHCYLQKEPSNAIRIAVKKYAEENSLDFYDVKKRTGFLRNLIIRNTSEGDLMVIVVFNYEDLLQITKLLDFVYFTFPEITSLLYVINNKMNDAFSDLEIQLHKGQGYITEKLENLEFKISPVSFYQTNSKQTYNLYKITREFANLTGKETVYDLYTGTGTIANFIASHAKKVIGIELIEHAIKDAKANSIINKIHNTSFFAGDVVKLLNDDFVTNNGKPNVIITDPSRAGMHKDVINQLIKIAPDKIVYVSCNPATQARDIELMKVIYKIDKIQPIDMFPHTHHVENVVLLTK